MKATLSLLVAAASLFVAPAMAQVDAGCIVAGRLSEGLWAPKFAAIHLFSGQGRPVATPTRQALQEVRRATLDAPALLSRCDGEGSLASADGEPAGRKEPAPALAPGDVEVLGVSFPRLRTGGTLVELRVRVPAERVVMLTR